MANNQVEEFRRLVARRGRILAYTKHAILAVLIIDILIFADPTIRLVPLLVYSLIPALMIPLGMRVLYFPHLTVRIMHLIDECHELKYPPMEKFLFDPEAFPSLEDVQEALIQDAKENADRVIENARSEASHEA